MKPTICSLVVKIYSYLSLFVHLTKYIPLTHSKVFAPVVIRSEYPPYFERLSVRRDYRRLSIRKGRDRLQFATASRTHVRGGSISRLDGMFCPVYYKSLHVSQEYTCCVRQEVSPFTFRTYSTRGSVDRYDK